MNRGVVLFAFNNEATDYVSIARWSAERIKRHLDVPVCLITDTLTSHPEFDQIILANPNHDGQRWMSDYESLVSWKNFYRYQVYELSPFVETLLLDVDYVVCSDQLNTLWEVDQDIMVMGRAHDVVNQADFSQHNFFGRFDMKSAWATVIKFKRSTVAEAVFDMMSRIQHNWQHYRDLYGIGQPQFRNDFALAIAMHVVHGNLASWPEIPWSMGTILPDYDLIMTDHDSFEIVYTKPNGTRHKIIMANQDFHAMNKKQLGEIIVSAC